jgi:hypothetical protein
VVARDPLAPVALEEARAVHVDFEPHGQVEVRHRAGLAGVGPDLDPRQLPVPIGFALLPSIDHVGFKLGMRGLRVPRRHPQGLGGVQPPAVRDDGLAAVVDVDRHRPGDHVLVDPPDGRVGGGRAPTVECLRDRPMQVRGLGAKDRHGRIARAAGGRDHRELESGRRGGPAMDAERRREGRRPQHRPQRRRQGDPDTMPR